jgi:outer membrane protein assembly factor BamD
MMLFPACAGKEIMDKSADELANDGMKQYKNKKYKASIQNFEKLKDLYPFNKLANLAELKIADAHYNLGEYDEAVMAYEEFENLHPSNEAIPYVIYQIGMCYYKRVDKIDRDQTVVKKALDTFVRLNRQFPDDPYSLKARDYMDECRRSLAEYEFYVGIFYFKNMHYDAALKRFSTVITDYPDVGVHQKALHYIALCKQNIANQAMASEGEEEE